MKRWFVGLRGGLGALCSAALVFAFGGCDGVSRSDPHIAELQQLNDKIAAQGRLITQQDAQIASQARLIQDLRGAGDQARFARLVRVQRAELERLSGAYDDNGDGVPDGIVLYLRLFDAEGDVIKAAGSAKARVLDLSGGGDKVVARGEWSADQMREIWYGKLLTSHYTLKLPLGPLGASLSAKMLTAIVEFTDLLSGETLSAQTVLQILPTTVSNR